MRRSGALDAGRWSEVLRRALCAAKNGSEERESGEESSRLVRSASLAAKSKLRAGTTSSTRGASTINVGVLSRPTSSRHSPRLRNRGAAQQSDTIAALCI